MLLDFVSVLNCELLANVSCNNFAKALTVAYYEDFVVAANNINAISHNNIVSIIEFKYRDDVICIGYLVEHDDDKDIYIIDLDNVVVGVIKYDISTKVANHNYVCKANNITAANANWIYSVVNKTLASKVVREVRLTIGVILPFGRAFPP